MSYGTLQHRVPASVIGRFGSPGSRPGSRYALVCARDLQEARRFGPIPAERVGAERGAYDYDIPGRTADGLWEWTEQVLPKHIDVLERVSREVLNDAGRSTVDDLLQASRVVFRYVAELTVRHRGFDGRLEADGLRNDEIQAYREDVAQARRDEWASLTQSMTVLVSRRPRAPRLVMNDWGWTMLTGAAEGVFAPLGPHVAVLVHLRREGPADFGVVSLDDHIEAARQAMLTPTTDGVPGPRFVYGHPHDLAVRPG